MLTIDVEKLLIILFVITVLFVGLLVVVLEAKAVELTEQEQSVSADGGIYFEWLYSQSRDTYTWGYGQRFGSTVLAIEGIMFQEADTCVKYEGEERKCTLDDYRFIRSAFKSFQNDEIIWFDDWVFNTIY